MTINQERPVSTDFAAIKIGDKIRFQPSSDKHRWWTVRDRDNRFIVATMQAPFKERGMLLYTVVDITGWQDKRYNGAGNGVVRSSLNTLGGGWDLGPNGEGAELVIPALRSDGRETLRFELSNRRVVSVWSYERWSRRRPKRLTTHQAADAKAAPEQEIAS